MRTNAEARVAEQDDSATIEFGSHADVFLYRNGSKSLRASGNLQVCELEAFLLNAAALPLLLQIDANLAVGGNVTVNGDLLVSGKLVTASGQLVTTGETCALPLLSSSLLNDFIVSLAVA